MSYEYLLKKYSSDESLIKIINFVCEKIETYKYPTIFEEIDKSFQESEREFGLYGRLKRVILQQDTAYDAVPSYIQTWQEFCAKNPVWNDPLRSYVCFRDDPRYLGQNILKQRVQNSSLCYIHAPSVLVYYIFKRSHPSHNKLLDISTFVKDSLTLDALYQHLFGDVGGDSLQLLRILTNHKAKVKSANVDDLSIELLQKFGPLLVHSFLVYDDLINVSISSHTQETLDKVLEKILKTKHSHDSSIISIPTQISLKDLRPFTLSPNSSEIPDKKHALVLVGIRVDEDNRTFCLFQNWWHEKQFFETDLWYLEKCEVSINYIANDLTEIREDKLLCGECFETFCDFSNQNVGEIYMVKNKN
jgi:hypothetical protein